MLARYLRVRQNQRAVVAILGLAPNGKPLTFRQIYRITIGRTRMNRYRTWLHRMLSLSGAGGFRKCALKLFDLVQSLPGKWQIGSTEVSVCRHLLVEFAFVLAWQGLQFQMSDN